jgi:hypothetical protein
MHGCHGNFETHPKPGVKFGGLVVVELFIQKMPNPILKIQILEVSLRIQYELEKNSFIIKMELLTTSCFHEKLKV